MSESSLSVADFFLSAASKDDKKLRPMKLLKLVYLAHGWNLGLESKPLICEDVQAWQYGPVIPDLYHTIKGYRDEPIPRDQFRSERLDPDSDHLPLLEAVWEGYRGYSDVQLSTLTHKKGSPWDIVWNGRGGCNQRGALIPNELIEDYYKREARSARGTPAA